MIVISGALVAVAFVLLVIGLFQPDLDFVYASIAVSGAAFVFLIIGIFQRRGEVTEGADATSPAVALADSSAEATVTTIVPAREPVEATSDDDSGELSGTVLVVADRPRYHVAGCRYLAGKDAEEVDVREARAEGFTPCGVCKPDAQLVTTSGVLDTDEDGELVDAPAVSLEKAEAVEPDEAAAPVVRRGTAAVKKAPAKAAAPAKKAAPAKAATPAKKAAPAAPAKKAAPATKAAPTKAAPIKAAPTKAAQAAAAPKKPGTVVVIPDRGKFHTAQCRYVRGVDGAEELTRAQATRQGYDACGVCKP